MTIPSAAPNDIKSAIPETPSDALSIVFRRDLPLPRFVAHQEESSLDGWAVIGQGVPSDLPTADLRHALEALRRTGRTADFDLGMTGNGARVLHVATPELRDREISARYAGQIAGRALRRLGCRHVAIVTNFDDPALDEACAVGVRTGAYQSPFAPNPYPPCQLSLHQGVSDAALARIVALSNATTLTRALVEAPANLLTPDVFAGIAVRWAADAGLHAIAYDADDLIAQGFVATSLIGASSTNRPRAVLISNTNARDVDMVIVGKGVTFDAGGISLKPAANMGKLKGDMAGAAAALCAAITAVELGLTSSFAVVMPLAENLPDGNALRPGDVITFADGTRVHVDNTDAEGRMLLADGVCFARNALRAKRIVTIGTLTKACIVALGNWYAALYTHGEHLANILTIAGRKQGERVWRMPLGDEYRHSLCSPVADLSNASNDGGGSILAATFIGAFAGTTPWAHIDMSSIFFMDQELPWADKGYTGAGARLLHSFLLSLSDRATGETA